MDQRVKSESQSDHYGATQPAEPSPGVPASRDGQQSRKNAVRKRTKTGCLTCRKRRIKCDEAKPTCTNCIKSRRQCEGYSQRLTFKEPLGAFHHHPAIFGPNQPVYPHHGPDTFTALQPPASHQARSLPAQGGSLPVIAPRPPEFYQFDEGYPPHPGPVHSANSLSLSPTQFSPQNAATSSSFNHPQLRTPISAQTELGTNECYDVISPSVAERGDGSSSQYSPFNGPTPQALSRNSGYTPQHPVNGSDAQSTPVVSHDDNYWNSDDEASMGESEDDGEGMDMNDDDLARLESNELGIQVARHLDQPFAEFYGTQIRTFTGFVDPNNVLETYTPSSTNSPLNDTQTAAVFWYFVNVTGPSMSLYERHPFDPSPLFQGEPVPKARQHIWTYTFPIIAFNHPALLQAMLALGSLQMAKLQGIPATASMKHYHLSLRRIAKNYQSPTRRTQPATLAATLLLGFYEIWNSDHDKWCKHMWGARAIIKEIPFREMTKAVMRLQRRRRQRLRDLQIQRQQQLPREFTGFDPSGLPLGEDPGHEEPDLTDVNAGLVSQLTGMTVTYEEFGHVYNEDGLKSSARRYTDHDIDMYEHLSDLYWWYCKMDVYQSVLGGTKLFMEYDLWTQCAPRGPFNRADAIYGTYDHLMLLLGRMCNFAAQDVARKRRAIKRNQAGAGEGGNTRPGNMDSGPSPPTWPGLFPTSGKVTVPTGFSPPRETSPQSDGSGEVDYEESTASALREWESIRQAFEIFRANLGPDFDPLGPEHGPPQQTPFGPARTYRTFNTAGIWLNYYMGLIMLHRTHPTMPPVAMVAAGMAAHKTGVWANEIGRIAAGLTTEDCSNIAHISTVIGAAFIESCFCLFVAGVQYRDEAQRHWTVRRLHDIARLTGWQSAKQIADGCESSWVKAAQLGRGPPYQRAPDVQLPMPESVWENPRRIDRRINELNDDGSSSGGANSVSSRQEDKFVLTKSERTHYALGLLGVEHDFERLELREAG